MASIEKRGKGFQVRYYDPDGRRRAKTLPTYREARAFKSVTETEIHRGSWIDPAGAGSRFDVWAEEWIDNQLALRPSSLARDKSYLKNHIALYFAAFKLGRISQRDVQLWVKQLSEKGLVPRTSRECYRILANILKSAVEAGLISESPCRGISLPRVINQEPRFLSHAELQTLSDAMHPGYSAMVIAAGHLGLRWGELAGLRTKDIDFLKRELHIVGKLEEVNGNLAYVGETKTKSGSRTLMLRPYMVEILAHHLEGSGASDFVFTGKSGAFLRRSNFRRRYWLPALEQSGVGHLRFHDLRHTCAALMIAAGGEAFDIMRQLGHKDIRTTMNQYGHMLPDRQEVLARKMEVAYLETREADGRNVDAQASDG